MEASDKICIALDVDTLKKATSLVEKLKDHVGLFKIGIQLYSSEGPTVVEAIKQLGGQVFLDVKFHDIPNTVSSAARIITRLGVLMFNIHTLGGYEMMARTAEAARDEAEKLEITAPKILGVTVLTSVDDPTLESDLKVNLPLKEYVLHLAALAKKAGLDGVIASPKEVRILKESLGKDFLILTPGIRPLWSVGSDDQKRITTPSEAIKKGSDYIVIGRPIISAEDPVEAAKRIVKEIDMLCQNK